MTDPLKPLMELPGVADAAAQARDALARVHRHRANRRGWNVTAAEAAVRAARASALLDGGTSVLPAGGLVSDPVLAGALRVGQALDGDALVSLTGVWRRSPLQALARLHLLAAADLTAESSLGRPRPDPGVSDRLNLLAHTALSTTVAAPVVAAVVHGELCTLRPFGTADGIVARAASRLVAVATGLDPHSLGVPEVAFMRSPDRYRELAAGFATGEPAAVAAWITLCCEAFTDGAREATSIAEMAS